MSLKENMQTLKDELSTEEKFFENAIRTERFVKKYQKPLIFGVVSMLLAVGTAIAYQTYDNAQKEKSNAALNALLMNPGDKKALEELKSSNTELLELYHLSKAIQESDLELLNHLKTSSSAEVADLAAYEVSVLNKNTQSLDTYTKKQGALYEELALIELAVIAIQKGNVQEAQNKLSLIKEESSLYPVASTLRHYGVK